MSTLISRGFGALQRIITRGFFSSAPPTPECFIGMISAIDAENTGMLSAIDPDNTGMISAISDKIGFISPIVENIGMISKIDTENTGMISAIDDSNTGMVSALCQS